jgi:hypothetical protein
MRPSSGPNNTSSKLSDSLLHQLNMYAIAASAAGVGALALAPSAQAKIVYTRAHRVINNGQHYNLDLNHDGVTDFVLVNSVHCTDQCFFNLTERAPSRNGAIGFTRGSFLPYASALYSGSPIGQKQQFVPGRAILGYVGSASSQAGGLWINVTNRYLGLQFHIKGKLHYGWARLNVKISGTTVSATLTGYAYDTIPNKAIIAGQTKGPEDRSIGESIAAPAMPTRKPSTLGLLAQGSSALSSPATRGLTRS